MRIVLVDNHDSYTFNLAAQLHNAGAQVRVLLNDDPELLTIEDVDAIVLSPGPGSPMSPADVGHGPALLARLPDVPVLGVCLGHQLLALLHGGEVVPSEPAHGRVSSVRHDHTGLLAELPQGFPATRYHSMVVRSTPAAAFAETAWSEDEAVMAIAVEGLPRWGVQFHPESIETPDGSRIIAAFLEAARSVPIRAHVAGPFDPGVVFTALYAEEPHAFWLDGQTTYLGAGIPDNPTGAGRPMLGAPLPGGYVGCRSYEGDDRWMRADRVIALTDGDLEVTALPATGAREWLEATVRAVEPLRDLITEVPVLDIEPAPFRAARTRSEYLDDIAVCKDYLARGESYEICLTNRLHLEPIPDPLALHRQLRARNPSPRSAFLRFDELAICSATPETFLTVSADGTVVARPIKGTAPRHENPATDIALAAELVRNPKTRAENLMIVDLLRNDLNRICEPGSVAVIDHMAVESYANLHQLTSTVTGRLRPDLTAIDAVRAAFPPGSMTGAPKERTTAILAELEPEPRGVYSGFLGLLGADGSADLSVVIRTAVCSPDGVTIGTGGAIVWASDPDDEYAETMIKARPLLQSYAAARH